MLIRWSNVNKLLLFSALLAGVSCSAPPQETPEESVHVKAVDDMWHEESNDMKQVIFTEDAPAPIGPYSQAILHGSTLYISGQVAIDPTSGDLVTDNIQAETHQVMKNLQAVLTAAEMDFSHVVKCTIFMKDLEQFSAMNEIYGSYFEDVTLSGVEAQPPARECVQAARLPKDVNVEISAIAVK